MPSPPEKCAGTASQVVLLEEYAALASAFSALLRKFAPESRVRVVQSFVEVERAAAEQPIDLLIADFDPAQKGAVAFFKRLRENSPATHVIIIAADDAREIAAEPNGPAAFTFLKKPFEVNGFGRTVAQLLAPAATALPLQDLALIDLLVLQAVSAASGILEVRSAHGRSGEIHFSGGKIAHAVCPGLVGVTALQEILRWPAPRVDEVPRQIDAPCSVQGGWAFVLLEALRATRPNPRPLPPNEGIPAAKPISARPRPLPSPPPPPEKKTAANAVFAGKKILVIDDTEMLLVFVDEILSTADPELKIVTAANGLDGVERAREEQPDLILLDYSLPDITGGEVCQRLLANPETARLPVVMMSGHVPEMLNVAERCENVVAAIPKPFLSTSLLELVEKTLADLPKLIAARRKKPKIAAVPKPPAPPRSNSRKQPNGEHPAAVPPAAAASETPPAPAILPPPAPPTIVALPPLPNESSSMLAPALVHAGNNNAVVLTLPLEVLSIQFSPSLQMKAIRARPFASTVSLHVLPQSLPGSVIPEAGFELAAVDLDARGQIDTIRLVPTTNAIPSIASDQAVPMAGIALLPSAGESSMELMPAPTAPMRMQLTALFELAGVELSSGFRVAHLILKWRGGKMRVSLQQDAAQSGVTFETAQVLLDRSARIAEVLLDAVA